MYMYIVHVHTVNLSSNFYIQYTCMCQFYDVAILNASQENVHVQVYTDVIITGGKVFENYEIGQVLD